MGMGIGRGGELEDVPACPLPQQLGELARILVDVVSESRVRVSRNRDDRPIGLGCVMQATLTKR
jgi:hypothetical protein